MVSGYELKVAQQRCFELVAQHTDEDAEGTVGICSTLVKIGAAFPGVKALTVICEARRLRQLSLEKWTEILSSLRFLTRLTLRLQSKTPRADSSHVKALLQALIVPTPTSGHSLILPHLKELLFHGLPKTMPEILEGRIEECVESRLNITPTLNML